MHNPEEKTTPVFVSYSRRDKKWLERLQVHLKPLVHEGDIDLWDDTRIRPGADWKAEIDGALARVRVAVFLVSPDFLASDFIHDEELPALLEAAEKRGTRILPVILSHCQYTESKLARFQAINASDKPLKGLTPVKQDEVLLRLARTVAGADTGEGPSSGPPSAPRAPDTDPSSPPTHQPAQPADGTGPYQLPTPALLGFGGALLLFLFGVFVFAPDTLPAYKQPIIALIAALLAGLCGWILSGTISVRIKALQSRVGDIAVRATGGVALFALVLLWWPTTPAMLNGDSSREHDKPAATLAGSVLDTAGEPLSGVRISLPNHGLNTTTDRLGRFRLQIPVGAGTMVTYVAQHPDHRTYEDYAAAGTFGIKFKLERKEP